MTYSLRDQFYELLPAKLRAAAGLKSGASGSHLNSIINGFQVQGNSDIPSFLHHCAAWLSSFMMYQEWLLNERTRLTKVRVWFVVNAQWVFSPSGPVWAYGMPPGGMPAPCWDSISVPSVEVSIWEQPVETHHRHSQSNPANPHWYLPAPQRFLKYSCVFDVI